MHKQIVLFFILCLGSFLSISSWAQVSEPIEQVFADAFTKYKINLGLILDRSILRESTANYLVLQNATASSDCNQQTQSISMVRQNKETNLLQSLIFTDCNRNQGMITIIQESEGAVEVTLKDWLNGDWKLSEMKAFKMQLSHRKLFIEKQSIVRESKTWLHMHFDYTDVPDKDIPTDIARLNFEELKADSQLQRNYYIDVGRASPPIYLRYQNFALGLTGSKDAFLQPYYFDQLTETSPKFFASQYQSYLTNIVFKAVQNAIGTIPLILPNL